MEEIDELLEAGFENDKQMLPAGVDDCLYEDNKRAKNLWVARQLTSGRHRNQSIVLLSPDTAVLHARIQDC